MSSVDDYLDNIHKPPNLRKVKGCGYCIHYKRGSFYCKKFDSLIFPSCLCDDFEGNNFFNNPAKTGGINNE